MFTNNIDHPIYSPWKLKKISNDHLNQIVFKYLYWIVLDTW